MKKYLQSESLKNKNSLIAKMVIVMPVFFTLFSLSLSGLMFGSVRTEYFMAVVYNWFPVFFCPIIIGIFSNQVVVREEKNKLNESQRSLNLALDHLWLSKIMVVARDYGVIMLLNLMITLLLEYFWLLEDVNYLRMIICSVVIWLSGLVLIPISMLLSYYGNSLVTILVNFIFSFIGGILASEKIWFLCPWSWGARMTAPLLGIAPNGLFIAPGDPLLNPNVLPLGLCLAIITLLGMTLFSIKAYQGSEERGLLK